MPREPERCPKCGAPGSERDLVKGFGGHVTELCKRCGHVFVLKRMKEAPK